MGGQTSSLCCHGGHDGHKIREDKKLGYYVGNRPTLNPDGSINWKVWQEIREDPRFPWMVYDPPQKKAEYAAHCRNVNFFQPRAWIGRYPPCCFADCLKSSCTFGPYTTIQVSKADEWLPKFLEVDHAECPEHLRGVWWMRDNVANETLVTFQDMMFKTTPDGRKMCLKDAHVNWSAGSNMWGSILQAIKRFIVPFEFEPCEKPKWLAMATGDDYIYMLDEEDKGKLVYPDGKPMEFIPGLDMMRISSKDGTAANGIAYQYMMRKIAYKDKDGKIVKTQYYDELAERCTRPTPDGCCCNLFLCNVADENYGDVYDALDDHQIVVWQQDKYPAGAENDPELLNALNEASNGNSSPQKASSQKP